MFIVGVVGPLESSPSSFPEIPKAFTSLESLVSPVSALGLWGAAHEGQVDPLSFPTWERLDSERNRKHIAVPGAEQR